MRAALDVGEYNLGQYSEPLQKGVDVPSNAVFFDEATASDIGSAGGPIGLASPGMSTTGRLTRPYDVLALVGVQDWPQVSTAVVSKASARLRRQGLRHLGGA